MLKIRSKIGCKKDMILGTFCSGIYFRKHNLEKIRAQDGIVSHRQLNVRTVYNFLRKMLVRRTSGLQKEQVIFFVKELVISLLAVSETPSHFLVKIE